MTSYIILEVFKKLLDSLVSDVVIEFNIFCRVSRSFSNWTDTIPHERLWIFFCLTRGTLIYFDVLKINHGTTKFTGYKQYGVVLLVKPIILKASLKVLKKLEFKVLVDWY